MAVVKPRQNPKVSRALPVPRDEPEKFYMRLMQIRVPYTSYENLLTVDGLQHANFTEAARSYGLVHDEREYTTAMLDMVTYTFNNSARIRYFVGLLLDKAPGPSMWSNPQILGVLTSYYIARCGDGALTARK